MRKISILLLIFWGSLIPSTARAGENSKYRNEKYGFEISYPSGLKTTKEFIGHYHVAKGKWRQADPNEDGVPVVGIVVYRPKGDAAYPDVEVRVGVKSGSTLEEACGWSGVENPYSTEKIKRVTINGVQFQVFDISNGGMSQFIEGESYQTYHSGYCYSIERFVTDTSYYDDNAKAIEKKRAEDKITKDKYESTEGIVKSFRFLKN